MYVYKKPSVVQVIPEPEEQPEEKNLLQEDAFTQAELDYLLKVKTAIVEPDPMPVAPVAPIAQKTPQPLKRPESSFPIDEAPWVEAESA
jgi:hypothetical protein